MIKQVNRFWMVLNLAGEAPTYRHRSFDAARAEAERLAQKHPGQIFVVLEPVTAIVKRDIDVLPIGGRSQTDIPF